MNSSFSDLDCQDSFIPATLAGAQTRQEEAVGRTSQLTHPHTNVPRLVLWGGASAALQKGFTLEHARKNLLDKDKCSHFTEFCHAVAHLHE